MDRFPGQAYAELADDALGGVVADLRDADDLVQVAVDQAEAKSRCCRFGCQPAAPERASEPPADLDRWHHLGEELRYRQPGEADQLAGGAQLQGEHPEAALVPLALPGLDARLGLLRIPDGSVSDPPHHLPRAVHGDNTRP